LITSVPGEHEIPFMKSMYNDPAIVRIQLAHIMIILMVSISVHLDGQSNISTSDNPSRPDELTEIFSSFCPDCHTKKIWGRRYSNPYYYITEHQFFKSKIPLQGVLITKDDTINCTQVLYDLYRDKLIVHEPTIGFSIEIEEELIRRFKLFEPEGDGTYEFINAESLFYQIIFEGERLDFYIKHQKLLAEMIDGDHAIYRFENVERLVLRKGAEFHNIKRNRDLLKNYPEAENEIKEFLRRSDINIKSANNDQIQMTGKFIDELVVQ
jgi:hypothetical protein